MSIFSKIGKAIGGLIKKPLSLGGTVAGVLPGGGIVKTGIGALGKLGKRVNRKVIKGAVVGGGLAGAGVGLGELMGGGFGGGPRKRYRRMNPGNTRALGRAMRRIEAGARIFKRYYTIKHGGIRGAHGVRMKGRRRRVA